MNQDSEHADKLQISESTFIKTKSEVFSTIMDDEVILFNPQLGTYFGSDTTGAAIWSKIQDGITFAMLCQALEEVYEIGAQECQRDVASYIRELEKNGLVTLIRAKDL